jgi:hypothetical protein
MPDIVFKCRSCGRSLTIDAAGAGGVAGVDNPPEEVEAMILFRKPEGDFQK